MSRTLSSEVLPAATATRVYQLRMLSVKRKREDFSQEEVQRLEASWQDGMRSTSQACQQQVSKLAEELGVTKERVEMWIGNRRAKERREGHQHPISRKPTPSLIRGPNAYSYFARTVERGTLEKADYLRCVGERWRALSDIEKLHFSKLAQAERLDPAKGKSRDEIISHQLKQIGRACDILSTVGYSVGGMGLDKTKNCVPAVFGSPCGVPFFSLSLQDDFETFVKAANETVGLTRQSAMTAEQERKLLKGQVRQYFHSCWVKATASQTQVPYKKIRDGNVEVVVAGLPENVDFREPSSYGVKAMKAILASNLNFTVRNVCTQNADPSQQTHSTATNTISDGVTNGGTGNTGAATVESISKELQPVSQNTETLESIFKGLESGSQNMETEESVIQSLQPRTSGSENLDSAEIDQEIKETNRRKRKSRKQSKWSKKKNSSNSHDSGKAWQYERIVGERVTDGQKYVCIRWMDGTETWEPESNLV